MILYHRFGTRLVCTFFLFAVASSALAKRPNVLLICIDDLRPELRCFGKDYIASPAIDQLAAEGRAFPSLRAGPDLWGIAGYVAHWALRWFLEQRFV